MYMDTIYPRSWVAMKKQQDRTVDRSIACEYRKKKHWSLHWSLKIFELDRVEIVYNFNTRS